MNTQLKKIDYLPYLEQCWQEHLLSRSDDAPTVISLFAGCGGSSLGYSMAGFKELLVVEWDDNAVDTFRLNFPEVPIYHGDISECSIDWILENTGLQPGQLDILDGSPPCQGFSTAGKRIMDDPRNNLFEEYVRILRGLQPKVFVMENVSGMVKGKMKLIFAEIMQELKSSGYKVSARLLNAMWFGVPQSRERMIFIGVREDLGIEPSHPKAIYNLVSANIAIFGAAVDDCGRPKGLLVDRMKKVLPGSNLSRTENHNSLFSYVRCPINKPCMTIQKSISFGGITIWHPYEDRNLSKSELKRISSYPDNFLFAGNYKDFVNRIGNSVPPLFMREIAQHIKNEILDKVMIDN